MKKILLIVGLLGAAALVFAKLRSSKAENDLWHDATTS
jgi:hypothetical protein